MQCKAIQAGCLALLLVTGCAPPRVALQHPHGTTAQTAPQLAWHQLRFRWAWPQGQAPRWFLDPLLADLVLADLIAAQGEALPLWRFHRRAGRGPAGHQFSLIVYSTEATATALKAAVTRHPVTTALMEHALLEKVYMTTPANAGTLRATSDPDWPAALQATWPAYIMGVSQTWLGLVQAQATRSSGPAGPVTETFEQTLRHYRTVHDDVSRLWYEQAQHAFFHHASGVFGYQPVRIRKRMRF